MLFVGVVPLFSQNGEYKKVVGIFASFLNVTSGMSLRKTNALSTALKFLSASRPTRASTTVNHETIVVATAETAADKTVACSVTQNHIKANQLIPRIRAEPRGLALAGPAVHHAYAPRADIRLTSAELPLAGSEAALGDLV